MNGGDEGNERLRAVEAKLESLQRRYDRLTSRRSVRAALAIAGLASRVRRSRREPTPAPPPSEDPVSVLRAGLPAGPDAGPLVSIVVLTRDGEEHLATLLTSLTATTYRSFELIVVDNASSDGTARLLRQDWGIPLRVIENPENVSFSRGCNQGASLADGDLLLFLNNDVEPVSPGWLGCLVDAVADGVGAVGAVLAHPGDETVHHHRIGYRTVDGMPRPWNVGGRSFTDTAVAGPVDVPAATAACLLVRREAYEQIAGFDEGYEYGMEDVDLCMRLGEAGWRLVVTWDTRLHHHESATVSRWEQSRWRATRLANRRRFEDRWSARLRRSMALESTDPSGFLVPTRGQVVAITVTEDNPAAGWGDWYTAHELGDAFEAMGWTVRYVEGRSDRWYDLDDSVAVVVSLIDRFDARRAPADALCIAWVRNWTDRWSGRPWLDRFDVVVPSSRTSRELLLTAGVTPGPVLPLATNPTRFRPGPASPELRCDVAFTGNHWGVPRKALDGLGEDLDVAIYGRGWADVPAWRGRWRGHKAYDELPAVYRSARIVLDDTAAPTLPYGAVNSRVFDALASGTLVVSDNREGSQELFGGRLPTYLDVDDLGDLLGRYLGDEDLRRRTLADLRSMVLAEHTYEKRAVQMLEAARTSVLLPKVAILTDGDGGDGSAQRLARSLRSGGTCHARVVPRAEWSSAWARSADVALHRVTAGHPPEPVAGRVDVWWSGHPAPDSYDIVLAGEPEAPLSALLDEIAARPFAVHAAGQWPSSSASGACAPPAASPGRAP